MDSKKNNLTEAQEKALFSKLEVPYSRTKSEVWDTLSEKLKQEPPVKATKSFKILSLTPTQLSLAASILLFVGLGLFAKYYTTTIEMPAGAFTSHVLPDGSTVHLNAASSISYAPYWWSFDRVVELNGEAFFEVAKGERFAVYSDFGTTEVLGTKFNIYARDHDYQVYCLTGKVKVSSGESVTLTPGEYASLNNQTLVKQSKDVPEDAVLSWRMNKFLYNTTPLIKVLKDVERHYNVKIDYKAKNIDQYHYTGLFNRSMSIEEALEIICYSFDLKFEIKEAGWYIIEKN